MFSLLNHPAMRVVVLCLMVVILFAPVYQPVQAGANPIVTLFVAVLTGGIGLLVYDAVSCDFNVFFYGCGGGGGGGGNGGGGNGSGNGTSNGAGSGGQGSGSGTGGSTATQCGVSVANACNMTELRFAFPGVACDLSPIPNNLCPVPVIGEVGFYADPARVRAGNTTTLHWDVTDATVCALVGGGLSLPLISDMDSSQETGEIEAATSFTLTCWNGDDGPQNSEDVVVTIVPSFEEI